MITGVFVHLVLLRWQLDPVTTDDLCVGQEPNLEIDVWLKRLVVKVGKFSEVELPPFEQALGRRNELRNGQRDLDEVAFFVALKSFILVID